MIRALRHAGPRVFLPAVTHCAWPKAPLMALDAAGSIDDRRLLYQGKNVAIL